MLQRECELQRCLPAELDEARHLTTGGSFGFDYRHHVFERQWLEIQPVCRVVVGRHGFGVAVDHDRLEPFLLQGEGGVTTAVVELDALADPIRTAAENHNLPAVVRRRLVAVFVGAVEVWRKRFELGGAGIDPLVNRLQAVGNAALAHRGFAGVDRNRQFLIAEPGALQPPQFGRGQAVKAGRFGMFPQLRDFSELTQKPRIDLGDFVQLFDRPAAANRAEQVPHPAVARNRQSLAQCRVVFVVHGGRREQQAASAQLQRPHTFHERFFERAADRHRLAHRFHLRGQGAVGLRELLEIPARNLDDDVVDGRFE